MSVLIKGMEMPTSCDKCPFLDYEEGFCFASGIKHQIESYGEWYELALCPGGIKDSRHEDCPLVLVPEHGDLIDRDALGMNYIHIRDDGMKIYTQRAIDNAPTIIKADESDMDSFIRIFEEDNKEDGMDSFIRILKD